MDAIRFPAARLARPALTAVLALVILGAAAATLAADLVDRPVVWYDDDRLDIAAPRERSPNLYKDYATSSIMRPIGRTAYPARQIRNLGVLFGGDHVQAAANVNTLDEVPNNSWFTNRIGLFPTDPAEAAQGPGDGLGPDQSAPWRVKSAKTEGVTPGFTIKDARGNTYLIKFDPPEYPGMTSAAGVISGRILHAAGYYTPDDNVVYFRAEDLTLTEPITVKGPHGEPVTMDEAYLAEILSRVHCGEDGRYRALASKYLDGKPIGPFSYEKTRSDDPNDQVNHRDRRELRGLRTFCAWINHFDTKQHNSLDMYVEENGRHFVRHHLIDFASTLGSGAAGPAARFGFEYTFSLPGCLSRLITAGLHENDWRRQVRPAGLDEIGYFDSENFDPREFRSLQTNPAFVNRTDRDGYWAAKIISAFTDEHLAAIVAEGKYENPEATAYMTRILAERRDKIARCYFDRIAPLDFFTLESGRLQYHDLGVERGIYSAAGTRYRTRLSACDAGRGGRDWSEWRVAENTECDVSGVAAEAQRPFVAIECQVDRGDGWSGSVFTYLSPSSERVLTVER